MKTIRLIASGLILVFGAFLASPAISALFCNGISSNTGSGGCGTPIAIAGTPAVVIPYQVSSASSPAVISWSVQLRSGGPMNCGPAGVAPGGGSPSATPSASASGAGFQMNAAQLYNQSTYPTSLTQGNAFLGLECACQTGTCLVDGWYETGQ
jgi:hypothetical protein